MVSLSKCLELLPHVEIKRNLDVRLFFPMCTLLHTFSISILVSPVPTQLHVHVPIPQETFTNVLKYVS